MKEIDRRSLPDRGIYQMRWSNHSAFCRIRRINGAQYIRYYADEELALTDSDWDVYSGNSQDGTAWYHYDIERLADVDPGQSPGTRPRLYLIDDPDHGGIEV